MATPAKTPRLTTAEIEEYLHLLQRRRQLDRESRALTKQAAPLMEKLEEFVRAKGGKQKSIVTCGYVVALITKNGTVAWKEEFVARHGIKEAERVIQAAPDKEVLTVEPCA